MSGASRPRQKRNAPTSSSSSSSASESSENESDSGNGTTADGKPTGTCDQCGKVGSKKLSMKNRRFCSVGCLRKFSATKQSPTAETKASKRTAAEIEQPTATTSAAGSDETPKKVKDENNSFDWRLYLKKPDFLAAPVSCFKHVALSGSWDNIVPGMKLEVVNTDCKNYTGILPNFYWIACIVKTAGYMALLRYEGCSEEDDLDFWVNLCTDDIHCVGWCSTKGFPLIPPKTVEEKITDWKQFLVKKLTGAKTLPADFAFKVEESLNNNIQKDMKLEVVDKNRISAVRVATVGQVIGGRLHVVYEGFENEDEGFWCHERSPLIHPVGWAQVIGHDLKATQEYAKQSLQKTLFREFDSSDATWDMFLPVVNPVTSMRFEKEMKLEAIDPLNLSTICVATVTKVLRNNYLMIGIDGMMAANGSDWFCYHASSPCIFPVGFCTANNITLTPPRGYKGEFKWEEYLKNKEAISAPVSLFRKDIPNHGFVEGMHLEAVDLMEPRLICVGSVTKVVGRLLRIHFDGWENAYDQWCDCESPDLFPIGWCQLVGYRLEAPRTRTVEDGLKKKKKMIIYRGQRRKRRGMQGKKMYATSHMSRRHQDKQKEGSDENSSSDNSPIKSRDNSNSSERIRDNEKKSSPVAEGSASKSSPSGQPCKSSLSESDPKLWTVSEVAQFLRINECGAYSQAFNQEKIDGPKFLALTKESLMSITGMKVGPSLKISHLIQQLKSGRKY